MIRTVPSFGKINLFLYVTGRRPDGYHSLYTLMTRIDLHDRMRFDFSQNQISVSCDHPDVPNNKSNLAYKAAKMFFFLFEKQEGAPMNGNQKHPYGVGIDIEKKIPVGGGLGGGSSNAASVLVVLNEYYGRPFSEKKLLEAGLALGADVPFFIQGTPSIATGVGEVLTPVANLPTAHLVLCDPGVCSSTAEVYKNIDLRLTSKPKYIKNTGSNTPILSLNNDVRKWMHNDLEVAACALYPGIRETKEEMSGLLRQAVYMTGSGSSLFALYSRREDAEQGYETLVGSWAGTDRKVFVSSFC